jgi:hypothetical protein
MARAKREYDELLAVTKSKTVRDRARSMKEASGVNFDRIPDEDQLGSPDFSTHVGSERVIDVVRAGDPWHFERAALGGGDRAE